MPTFIQTPPGYIVPNAVAFADTDGAALTVSAAAPLPVILGSAQATAVAGSTATSMVAGPYQPAMGRAVMLVLAGTWAGLVKVTRSVDGGVTRQPLTVAGTVWGQFSANCCEAVWEESEAAARLYLDIALTSGTLTYRMAQ